MKNTKQYFKGLAAMVILAGLSSVSGAAPIARQCYITSELYGSNIYGTVYYPVGSETVVSACVWYTVGEEIGAGPNYAYGIVTAITPVAPTSGR